MKSLQLQRTDATAKPIDDEEDFSPSTYLAVDLQDEVRTELEGWVKDHYAAIMTEMGPVLARFEDERYQLEGTMVGQDYPYVGAFRITDPVTKKKARETSNRIRQAFLDSDPIWAVTASEFKGLTEYTQAVERSLDGLVDHDLEAEDDISQAIFEGKLHGAGFLVPTWEFQEDMLRGFESYEGFDQGLAERGMVDESIAGIREFEENYPNWKDEKALRKVHSILRGGKKYEGEFSYKQPTRNLPALLHIPCKNVRAYPKTNGYSGLRTTPIYGYVEEYTLQELERLADQESIDESQLDRLAPNRNDDNNQTVKNQMEPFEVFIATIRYQLPNDEIPVRYKIWYELDKGIILRIRSFPWWNPNPDLIPLYSRNEEPGFFKNGLAWDLVEKQTISSLTYSMFFNAVDMANSMRWKTKHKSLAEQHLLSRRWSPHLSLSWTKNPNEVESLATPMNHISPLVQAIEFSRRLGDDETNTSTLQSGRESPNDPTAPASKTIALLKQVEPNTREDVRSMESGIRFAGQALLWMFYQGISLNWIDGMPGVPKLPPHLLKKMAENLNTRAMLFESDRSQELQADMLVLREAQTIYGQVRPDLIAKIFKMFVSGVSSKWGKAVDELDFSIPPPVQPMALPGQGGAAAGLPALPAGSEKPAFTMAGKAA